MSRIRKCLVEIFLPIAGLVCFLATPPLLAQRPGQGANTVQPQASLTVEVRFPDGSLFDQSAVVTLRMTDGEIVGSKGLRAGSAEFDGLGPGQFDVEVEAVGYQKKELVVEISTPGEHAQSQVALTRESSANPAAGPGGPPILAPKAQKEFSKAIEALRASNPEEAKKHLEKLSENAAGNPDVNYAWGIYYAELKDWTTAKSYWGKAVQIYPSHASSLAALGQVALQDGDPPTAIRYLERAAETAPSSWHFQELLAEAYLEHQEYEQAQKHAERAIEMGKERASLARTVLAKAVAKRSGPHPADLGPGTLLFLPPSIPSAEEAAALRDALRQPAGWSSLRHIEFLDT
jgi:Tfp pilus assembly protein PilF